MSVSQSKILQIKFLKQSSFMLEYNNSRLIIDPGSKKLKNLETDYIYATHNHTDHISAIEGIMNKNKSAKLICNQDVAKKYVKKKDFVDRIILAKPDEELKDGPWHFQFIFGKHGVLSSTLNLMVIIAVDSGESFGHAGDSVSIEAFKDKKLNYLAVPIGGLFTASPKKILKDLTEFEKPLPIIFPMHWILRSPEKFCNKLKKQLPDAICYVPK